MNHLLLHGLVATGDVFGQTPDRLARSGRVLVPDLLGFGRSLDEGRSDFSTEAHLDALTDLVQTEFDDGPIRIGAHSMGTALALRWAAAHPERVESVVFLGAPMWATPEDARAGLKTAGTMAKAFALDGRLAARLCQFNCSHRELAGQVSAAISPKWPIPIARQASLHTWPAYVAALQEQVIGTPWRPLIDTLDAHEIALEFVWGGDDRVGDVSYARAIADEVLRMSVTVVDGADHTLPTALPDLLVSHLEEQVPGV